MSTGYIGCGRRYYDGSGGNNHAIDYFKETGNGLCVKLGTITAEGTASIYCYKCDDDVHDPKLAEHMAVFGIDIAKAVKTESTMTELNLQANLNLTLLNLNLKLVIIQKIKTKLTFFKNNLIDLVKGKT